MSRHRQVDLLRSCCVGLNILFLILVSSEVSRRCAFIFLYSSGWMLVFLLRSSHGVATNVCDTQECCLCTITLTAQLERSDNIAKIPTSGFLIYWSGVNGSSRCWRKSADIYIVQDHQLSGFYVLAYIFSIHWTMFYRPLKALKYGKLHIKYTFFWNLFNHTLMSNTYLFVIKYNYLPGGVVVIFLLNYYFRIQKVFYNISWNQHNTLYFTQFVLCIFLYSIIFKTQQNALSNIQQIISRNTLHIRCQLRHISAPRCHPQEVFQQQNFVGPTNISALNYELKFFTSKHGLG